ncbi:MAG: type II secretion system protein GspM [Pseudomonadales bacterium]
MNLNSIKVLAKAWFDGLQKSEQRAVLLLGTFLLLVVGYLAIWVPAAEWQKEAVQDRQRYFETLTMMKETEGQARRLAQGAVLEMGGSLLSVVSTAAQEQGLNPNRLQPEGEDTVSLWFDEVPFAEVMRLLEKAAQIPGLQIQQLVIDRSDKPGTVRARVVISRS